MGDLADIDVTFDEIILLRVNLKKHCKENGFDDKEKDLDDVLVDTIRSGKVHEAGDI